MLKNKNVWIVVALLVVIGVVAGVALLMPKTPVAPDAPVFTAPPTAEPTANATETATEAPAAEPTVEATAEPIEVPTATPTG